MGAASSPNKASAVRFVLVAPYALKDVSIPLIYIESISVILISSKLLVQSVHVVY